MSELHLGIGKLVTEETKDMSDLERHQYMQLHDKITYCLYAALDTRLMILLNQLTKDISQRLPIELGISDIFDTNSMSARSADMFYLDLLADNFILGTAGSEPDKLPFEVVPLSGWPLTLPNDLHAIKGGKFLEDNPEQVTNLYSLCFTTDLTSAYPVLIDISNASKRTTKFELIEVIGAKCDTKEVYLQNMNIFGGRVNALDYAISILGYKDLTEIDRLIQEQ